MDQLEDISHEVTEKKKEPIVIPFSDFTPPSTPKKRGRPPKQKTDLPPLTQSSSSSISQPENEKTRRKNLIRRIRSYLKSGIYGPILAEKGIPFPEDDCPLDICEKIIDDIKGIILDLAKRRFVDSVFTRGFQGIEMFLTKVMYLEEYHGISDAKEIGVEDNLDFFDEELEEISLDLDDSWIPGAKIRLAMKVFNFLDIYLEMKKVKEMEKKKN